MQENAAVSCDACLGWTGLSAFKAPAYQAGCIWSSAVRQKRRIAVLDEPIHPQGNIDFRGRILQIGGALPKMQGFGTAGWYAIRKGALAVVFQRKGHCRGVTVPLVDLGSHPTATGNGC